MNLLFFFIGYASIQSLLLIYLLISTKDKRNNGIYFLVSLLIITNFIGIQYMLSKLGYREIYPKLFILGFSPMFFIPPLYYLFTLSNFNFKHSFLNTISHFIPFALALIISLQLIYISPLIKSSLFLFFVIQLLGYSIVSFRIIQKEKNNLKPTKVLKTLNICMLIFAICTLLYYIIRVIFNIRGINLYAIVIVFIIGFVTVLEVYMIKGLNNSSFDFTIFQVKKYKNSNLQSQNIGDLKNKLNQLISIDQVFLDQELKATDLAKMLGISRHQLTEFINQEQKCTFNDLMNKHRVIIIKKLLLDSSKKHLSISGLANEAGFKSSATFYRVFKNQTGFTPSEFIKNNS